MKWIPKRIVAVAFVVVSLLSGCGRHNDRCDFLIKRLQGKGVYNELVGWVDRNIGKDKLGRDRLQIEFGNNEHPRTYLAKLDFDWGMLGMYPASSTIRIGCDKDGVWRTVWLGNMRFAVIVFLKTEYVIKGEEIVYRDRRVAVYCAKD